jgi:hypothetical protein
MPPRSGRPWSSFVKGASFHPSELTLANTSPRQSKPDNPEREKLAHRVFLIVENSSRNSIDLGIERFRPEVARISIATCLLDAGGVEPSDLGLPASAR